MKNKFATFSKRMRMNFFRYMPVTLILGVLCVLPYGISAFLLSVFLILFMNTILALTMDLQMGQLGLINLAHTVYFGLGAYLFALFFINGIHMLLSSILSLIFVTLFAALMSYPFLRLSGFYFAVATLGLTTLVRAVILNFADITRGSFGITMPMTLTLTSAYYLFLGLFVATVIAYRMIEKSKFGLAINAIRDDEVAAEVHGIHSFRYKQLTLVVASIFPAIGGIFYTLYLTYIHVDMVIGFALALSPLAMDLLGGRGTLHGPIVGAVFIIVAEQLLWGITPYFHNFLLGAVIVLSTLIFPGGVIRSGWLINLTKKTKSMIFSLSKGGNGAKNK